MGTIRLPRDFSEFLKLLNSNSAKYLLVGGYAVNYYGYSRATGDMDIWISRDDDNIQRVVHSLQSFGFVNVPPEMLAVPGQVIRMGVPPLRLELLTSISGVEFEECFAVREEADIDGVRVPLIRLEDLIKNKRASGRLKDLADVQELE